MLGSPARPVAQSAVRWPRVTILAILTAATALPASGAVHQMFVTSALGTGNLGSWPQAGGQTGLAAGDAICRSLATTAGLTDASLYRAWLSTATTDGYCHVAGFSGKKASNCGQPSLPDAGPWERTDGVSFSHRLSDLTTTYDVLHPPFVDEQGHVVSTVTNRIFTGTDWNGAALNPSYDCNGWQSASSSVRADSGALDYGALAWTGLSLQYCDTPERLLCFDPGTGSGLPGGGTSAGAWVFVTSTIGTGDLGSWSEADGATGVAAGDAICRAQAAFGGFPVADSFVAWLSVAGAPAIDRIATDGPFRRPGGVEVAASKADLVALSPYLESDIETDSLRRHVDDEVLTGTDAAGQPTGDDCGGWTSSAATSVTVGASASASQGWTDLQNGTCDSNGFHLVCISNVVLFFADGFESGDTSQWSSVTP